MQTIALIKVATPIAGKLTSGGKLRQRQELPSGSNPRKPRIYWARAGFLQVGMGNACGNGSTNCKSLRKRDGKKVRRLIPCH